VRRESSGRSAVGGLLTGLALTVLAGLTGCSAGPVVPEPSPSVSASTSVTPTVPSDGVSLRGLGFEYGPAQFTVPSGAVLTTSADQPQQVTLVISSPAPAEVTDYLLRTLPATGFTVGRRDATAIEFSGHDWRGSYLVTGRVCAVTLQPVR